MEPTDAFPQTSACLRDAEGGAGARTGGAPSGSRLDRSTDAGGHRSTGRRPPAVARGQHGRAAGQDSEHRLLGAPAVRLHCRGQDLACAAVAGPRIVRSFVGCTMKPHTPLPALLLLSLQFGCGSTSRAGVAAAVSGGVGWHSATDYDVTYDCPGPCKNDTETCHCRAMTPQKDEAACRQHCDRSGCVAYAFQVSGKPYANGTRQCWWRTDIFFNETFTWGSATSCPPPVKTPCKRSADVSGCKLGINPITKLPWVPGCGTHPPLRTDDDHIAAWTLSLAAR